MTQNPNLNLDSETVEPIFGSVGVMEVSGTQQYNTAITEAYYDSSPQWQGLYVVLPNAEIKYFSLDKSQISVDGEFTGSILFQDTDGSSYYLRKVAETDGVWLSKYQTEIPLVALQKKILTDSVPAVEMLFKMDLPEGLPYFESMVVYYEPDMDDIYELAYISSAGTYVRSEASWSLGSQDTDKYEGLFVYEIDPSKANAVVELFDKQGVITTKDASKYSLQF